MNIKSVRGTTPSKYVDIENIEPDRPVSDDLIIGFAMAGARENPSSLFGWSVYRSEDGTWAIVTLNTD